MERRVAAVGDAESKKRRQQFQSRQARQNRLQHLEDKIAKVSEARNRIFSSTRVRLLDNTAYDAVLIPIS